MAKKGFQDYVGVREGILEGVTLLTAFGASETKVVEADVDTGPEMIGGSVERVQDWRDVRKALSKGQHKQVLGEGSVDLPQGIVIRGGHHKLVNTILEDQGGQAYSYTAEKPEKKNNLINADLNTIYEADNSITPGYKTQDSGRDVIVKSDNEELRVMEKRQGTYCIFTSEFEDTFTEVQDQFDGVILTGLEPMKGNIEAKTSKTKTQLETLDLDSHLDFSHLNDDTSEKIAKYVLPSTNSIAVGPNEIEFFAERLEVSEDADENEKLLRTVSRLFQAFKVNKLIYYDGDSILLVEKGGERLFPEVIVENLREVRESSSDHLKSHLGKADGSRGPGLSDEGKRRIHRLSDELNTNQLKEEGWVSSNGITVYAVPGLDEDSPSFFLEKMLIGSLTFGMLQRQQS